MLHLTQYCNIPVDKYLAFGSLGCPSLPCATSHLTPCSPCVLMGSLPSCAKSSVPTTQLRKAGLRLHSPGPLRLQQLCDNWECFSCHHLHTSRSQIQFSGCKTATPVRTPEKHIFLLEGTLPVQMITCSPWEHFQPCIYYMSICILIKAENTNNCSHRQ